MEAKVIQKARLLQLVDELIRDNEVIAPKDELSYGKVNSSAEVVLNHQNTTKSLKEFFFPEREELFGYRLDSKGVTLTAPHPSLHTPRVIFAARPCDAASFPILNKLFAWDYEDPFYLRRREKTIIISLACSQPAKTCFCVSVGGSPTGVRGSDLLLYPLDDVYYVRVISDKGKALIERHKGFFEESDEEQDEKRAQLEEEWKGRVTKEIDVEGLSKALHFESPLWETVARQCIGCGICTFLCPTCHCFDIQDEGDPSEGWRVRFWDSCAFQDFTKMRVSQPRPTQYRRYRQRVMHKFKYYPENFGEILCVGCGRCIQYCPVGIDITGVLRVMRG
jgi:ferredoxin